MTLTRWLLVLVVGLSGCFPDRPAREGADGADTSLGLDTTIAGDTEPLDTAAAVDTEAPDTAAPDTAGGECEGPSDCAHLAGTCVKLLCLGGKCAAEPDTGNPCTDGNPCTKADTCQGFACVGTAYGCDDGVACTDDVCTGDGGCAYPAKAGSCHIGGACVSVGTVKSDDPCRVCVAGESWSANDGASCEDGDQVCTLEDSCVGTECVGGHGPDDTEGDWAMNVVESVAPGQSAVHAVHAVGIGHYLMVAATVGGGSVPTTAGPLELVGRDVVAVRRATQSTYVEAAWLGFDKAELRASAARSGSYALAVAVSGSGTFRRPGGDRAVTDANIDSTQLVALNPLGVVSSERTLNHDVRSMGLLSDISVVVGGGSSDAIDIDELSLHHTVPAGDIKDAFVVRYAAGGTPLWAGVIETRDFYTGYAGVCASATDRIGMAALVRGGASLNFPAGLTSLTAASPNPSMAFLSVSASGEVETAVATLPFASATEFDSLPPELECLDDGLLATFLYAGISNAASGGAQLTTGRGGIARIDWDGTVRWGLSMRGFPKVAHRDGRVVAYVSVGLEPVDLRALDGTLVVESTVTNSAVVFELDLDGQLQWFAEYPSGHPTVARGIAFAPAGNGFVVGGIFFGQTTNATPSGALELNGGGDLNAFAAFMNSRAGLRCNEAP